jgi:hypothetical protein
VLLTCRVRSRIHPARCNGTAELVQVDLASSPRADLRMPPVIHLATHGFKASLNPVSTHCQRVNQVEALRMLGQNRRKHTCDNVFEPLVFSYMGSGSRNQSSPSDSHLTWQEVLRGTIRIHPPARATLCAVIGRNAPRRCPDHVSDPTEVRLLKPGCYPAQARAAPANKGRWGRLDHLPS